MPIMRDKYVQGRWRRNFAWQRWELELLSHWKQDKALSNHEIAKRFGISYSALTWKLKQHGFRKAIDWKIELPNLKVMVAQGRSMKWLARHYDVDPQCIRSACDRYGVPRPRKHDNNGLAHEGTREAA